MDALHALVFPRSIVIVGASDDPSKIGGRSLGYLLRDGFAGRLFAVNPKYREIRGVPCFPDIAALPEAPDAALVAVAAEKTVDAVTDLGRIGVRAAVVLAGGFREVGPEGAALERELVAAARRYGMRICGPNNNGLINAFDRMPLTISQYAEQTPTAAPIAFVSQSGAFGTAVALLARQLGIGLGFFVNTGNEADVTAMEMMGELLRDVRVRVGMAYLEGLSDGDRLVRVAQQAMALGKPVIVAKVGRFPAGQRAAVSHTGALAGEDAVLDGILRQHGMVRAWNETHAVDLVQAFCTCPLDASAGLAIVTMSGGAGALLADRAGELGMEVPELGAASQARLRAVLPTFAATANPVDLTAAGAVDPKAFGPALNIVLEDPLVGVCIVWLQHMHRVADQVANLLIDTRQRSAKPLIVCWSYAPAEALNRLRKAGVCVIESTHRCVDAAHGLLVYAQARRRFHQHERRADQVKWPPAPAPAQAFADPVAGRAQIVDTMEALGMLTAVGLATVPTRTAADQPQAIRQAEALGYPVAVKIESPDLPHKTEAGGVALGLADARQVQAATQRVLAAAHARHPAARINGVIVQKMAADATELVLGLRRDPVFGPVIMLGLGGIFIEVLKDVVFAAVPVDRADAQFMIRSLRTRNVLDGVRGKPPVSIAALVQAICSLSDLALQHPEIVELDLNPVMAGPDEVVAVDWLMVRTGA